MILLKDQEQKVYLTQMRKEVEKCKDFVERSRTKGVSMPTAPSQHDDSAKKNKRGPGSMLEKSWQMQDPKHLDALIARAFYSRGIPFNFARNTYLREAFTFAASNSVTGYQMPGYNKLREGLLVEERAHIDRLLSSTKSTWHDKGVTICADGWTDPQRRPLINFVSISGSSSMFLRADNCEGQVKTKEYIAEKLKSIIEGETRMWDVGGDSFESLSGVGILEVANLSLDEPGLQSVSFGDVDIENVLNVDE
jgi:hypothetical protein